MRQFNALEMCAGAGGQAIGLEVAGFDHDALVELEPAACATLRLNRPAWNVIEGDLRQLKGIPYKGIDLVAGGWWLVAGGWWRAVSSILKGRKATWCER